MCGIAGIASSAFSVERSTIETMCHAIAHRGPDHAGTYVHHDVDLSVGLGSRRLSIIDLGENGHMPMGNETGDVWIVYNGELYNHAELRADLIARGHVYRSRTDTETIIHAYEEYGLDCLKLFNGMYAFALYDQTRRRLVLARDPMGIKPLYYAWHGNTLVFGSELRALAASGTGPFAHGTAIEPGAMSLYFSLGYVPSPYCLVSGAAKLQPGHALVLENDQLQDIAFWSPHSAASGPCSAATNGDAIAHTRTVLTSAVKRQLMSDVPLGIFLSGGLDSTIITVLAQAAHNHALDTFSVGFTGVNNTTDDDWLHNQDLLHAREVAKALGTTHHEIVLNYDAQVLSDLLCQTVASLDEPFWEASYLSLHLMSQLARQHGVIVVLTGDGGDELFAGYPWYQGARRFERYQRVPFIEHVLPLISRFGGVGSIGQKARDLRRKLNQNPAAYYRLNHAVYAADDKPFLMRDAHAETVLEGHLEQIMAETPYDTLIDRLALADLQLWVREHFNQRVDRMSMGSSIEARVPFQDMEVVEFALGLPMAARMNGGEGKYLLRRAFADVLPDSVLKRPKRPFAAPMSSWLRGPLRAFTQELFSESVLRKHQLLDPVPVQQTVTAFLNGDDSEMFRMNALLNFQLWCEINL